jgi:hypothetical protein
MTYQTRRLNKRALSSQQTQVFEPGLWPGAEELAQLLDDGPVVLRGFAQDMPLVQKLDTDDFLAALHCPDKVPVKKGFREAGHPDALPAFEHAGTTGQTLDEFLAVYQKISAVVHYLAAYGENYDVAVVDSNRLAYTPKKNDPFRGPLRRLLPRTAKEPSAAAADEDAALDPGGRFCALAAALDVRGYSCCNVALWFSGRPVTTPLHYGNARGTCTPLLHWPCCLTLQSCCVLFGFPQTTT